MPTTYAHDLFGTRVLEGVSGELKNRILKEEDIFRIGLHGPDILFYYHPFRKNPVFQKGQKMHYTMADELFAGFKEEYQKDKNEKLLVYMLGFLCHYMLDSTCHPFIREYLSGHPDVNHDGIETELDRSLIEKNGGNPFRYRPACVIHPSKEIIRTVSRVMKPVSWGELSSAFWGMKFFTGITVGRCPVGRSLLRFLLKVLPVGDLEGRVMRKDYRPECEEGRLVLEDLFEQAIPEAVEMMEVFYQNRDNKKWVHPRMHHDFE